MIWQDVAETLRPPRGSPDGPLPPLLILLTLVTGIVDAVAYLRLGHVFVANMTGNVVFLGFAVGGATGLSVLGSLVAIMCFLPGGVLAARLAAREGENRLGQLRTATGVQIVLVAAAIAVAAVAGSHPGSASRYTLIVLLALAMGIQNATARRLAVGELTTTVLTMTLTGIAADSRLAGGSGTKTGRRLLAVATMALGAFCGTLLLLRVDPAAPLVLAAAILVVVCASSQRAVSRSRPTPEADAHARAGA
jgi:uncharacterized membrane protein YoaK (UPF0700 family)